MLGSFLTQWTIRLALACLAAYFAGLLLGYGERTKAGPRYPQWFAALRWIWTVGCVLFVAHVYCAFQFTHHWSHAEAWKHTDEETKRLMGMAYGDGIYFSYVFLLLWVVDVFILWLGITRPWWLFGPVYLFIFFIAFNGAIVFEDGPTRPVGLVVVVLTLLPLAGLFIARQAKRWLRAKDTASSQQQPVRKPAEAEA